MVDKHTQALKRLVKKLSALRSTLTKAERDILDELVTGAQAETSGHKLTTAATPKATTKPSARITSQKAVERAAVSSPEVTGHKMDMGYAATPAPTPQPSARASATGRIVVDQDTKTYKLID